MRLSRMMLSVVGLMLGSAISANDDTPADALQPANRSEVAMLIERLVVLEHQASEREAAQQARIESLARRVEELEAVQPVRRHPIPVTRTWGRRMPYQPWSITWFLPAVRILPEGEFASYPQETVGTFEPRPCQIRGRRTVHLSDFPDSFEEDPLGSDLEDFWIVPPSCSATKILERGLLIGVKLQRKSSEQPTLFESLENMLRLDGEPQNYGVSW